MSIRKAFQIGFIAMIAATAAPVAAQASRAEPVRVQMHVEHTHIQPGNECWVGVHFTMDPGWHTYWKNPGEVGLAPELDWELPAGFAVGEVQWPHPKRFEESDVVGFGYEESMVLLVQILTPADITASEVEIAMSATWVACADQCLPGAITKKVSIPILREAPKADPTHAPLFADARRRIPQQTEAVTALQEGGQVVFSIEASEKFNAAYFFPDSDLDGAFDYAAAQKVTRTDSGVSLALPGELPPEVSLSGVVVLMGDSGVDPLAMQVDASLLGSMSDAVRDVANVGGLTLGMGLLFAFLGGLILNLMPCVLPVISLKILNFVNMAGSDRKAIFRHGALFTMGVLASFWVLAIALLVLRFYGQSVGWGFQLQEPAFVIILVMVLFLLGLSLLGVFEFGTSLTTVGGKGKRSGAFGTFMSGILATLVATPCTGPLLAPALGYAVTLPALGSLAMFTMMGLGMASPYLLLAAFPKLINRLPKPGAWMVVFKQLMGFIMMATVLWLLWVFQAQVQSTMALMQILAALLILSVGSWIFGRWGTPIVKKGRRYVAYGLSILLLAGAGFAGIRATQYEPETHMVADHGVWKSWDPEEFTRLRAEGKPVFVDFTARWCLICQVNRVPLNKTDVLAAFEDKGVVLMEADWTRRDPLITAELAKHGRNGVPLYLYYGADDQPVILPQNLTSGIILDTIQ